MKLAQIFCSDPSSEEECTIKAKESKNESSSLGNKPEEIDKSPNPKQKKRRLTKLLTSDKKEEKRRRIMKSKVTQNLKQIQMNLENAVLKKPGDHVQRSYITNLSGEVDKLLIKMA